MTLVPLLAASRPQTIALCVVLVMAVGWLVYMFSTSRRTFEPGAEVVVAPNRKEYYSDDQLEGPRLTKYLWWAFAMLAISAIGLPLYWLREPYRQKGAGFDRGTEYFAHKSVQRGEELFQASPGNPPTPREPHFGCETCHGPEGVGGVATHTITDPLNPDAPARQVKWTCPPLNTVMLRYRPEEVRNIIVYGRPGTPMPPWGVKGGGPMNDQQIDDLIAYLQHIKLDSAKVKEQNLAQYGTDGQKIFDGFCARCHTMGFSYNEPGPPGGGALGPSLAGGAVGRQFPNPADQVEWVGKTADYGKLYGERGISEGVMPHFENELTPEQIQAVVDYERTL